MQHLISKALRYGPCVIKGSHSFYLSPRHEPYMPLLPSRKASLPLGGDALRLGSKVRWQLILFGEQRHTGVRNLPRVFMPRVWLRIEPTTSWSQVRHSTDSTTMTPSKWLWSIVMSTQALCDSVCRALEILLLSDQTARTMRIFV